LIVSVTKRHRLPLAQGICGCRSFAAGAPGEAIAVAKSSLTHSPGRLATAQPLRDHTSQVCLLAPGAKL
jgi:hypothetical protein